MRLTVDAVCPRCKTVTRVPMAVLLSEGLATKIECRVRPIPKNAGCGKTFRAGDGLSDAAMEEYAEHRVKRVGLRA